MAKVNVYLPDDLHALVSASDLNVSKVCQEALRVALVGAGTKVQREGTGTTGRKRLSCVGCGEVWGEGPSIVRLAKAAHLSGWRYWNRRYHCPSCWTLSCRVGAV